MYFPSDKLYIETKFIKLEEKVLRKEFEELAKWAKEKLNITIINVSYSLINNKTLPALRIILESQKDYDLMHGDANNPYNQRYNALIASNYLRILEELKMEGAEKDKAGHFHITYYVFSKVAIIECLNKIPKSDLHQIKAKFASNGLWEISIHHGSVILFYHKETDIEKNKISGISDQIKEEIISIALQYDEFGYLKKEPFFFGFDSKENFDEKYSGNWYYYFK